MNLYGFCRNDGINSYDYLGMDMVLEWDANGFHEGNMPFAPDRSISGSLLDLPGMLLNGMPTAYGIPWSLANGWRTNWGPFLNSLAVASAAENRSAMANGAAILAGPPSGVTAGGHYQVDANQALSPLTGETVGLTGTTWYGDDPRGYTTGAGGAAAVVSEGGTPSYADSTTHGESSGYWAAEQFTILAGQIAGGIKTARYAPDPLFGMGGWKGKNGNWYPETWGGNKATGGRLKYAAESSEIAGKIGRRLFWVGTAFSAWDTYKAARAGNGWGVAQGTADLSVGAAGEFLGPFGWAFAGGYFTGRLLDDTFRVSDRIARGITRYP